MWLYLVCILARRDAYCWRRCKNYLRKKIFFNRKHLAFFWRSMEMRYLYIGYGLLSFLGDKPRRWLFYQNPEHLPWRAMWRFLHLSSHKGGKSDAVEVITGNTHQREYSRWQEMSPQALDSLGSQHLDCWTMIFSNRISSLQIMSLRTMQITSRGLQI